MSLVLYCEVPRIPYQILEAHGAKIERCSVYVTLSSSRGAGAGAEGEDVARTETVPLLDNTSSTGDRRWFTVALTLRRCAITTAWLSLSVVLVMDSSQPVLAAKHSLNTSSVLALSAPPGSFFCPALVVDLGNDIQLKLVRDVRPSSTLCNTFGVGGDERGVMECTLFYHAARLVCRETCVEVPFAPLLSRAFLLHRITQMRQQLARMEALHARALSTQGYLAGQSGYSQLSLLVESISNLVQVQQRARQSNTLSSPFVVISLYQLHEQRVVGRTNTEYRTANPCFGSNSNLHLAEYANPRMYAQADRFGRLRLVQDQVWFETNISARDELVFQVFHERHSVREGGITSELMCTARLSFATLLVHHQQQEAKPVSLTLLDADNVRSGTLNLRCKLVKAASIAPDQEPVCRLPPFWLEARVCVPLRQQITQLQHMADYAAPWFKPSVAKAEAKLAAFATNLHQLEFTTEAENALLTTTSGVPSAIALPHSRSSETGLKSTRLQQERIDLTQHAHELLGGGGREEPLVSCPLSPSDCPQPILNMDGTCGNAVHLPGLPRVTPTSSTSLLRSAAVSMMSRFSVSNALPEGISAASADKASWQYSVERHGSFYFRETFCISQALPCVGANVLAEVTKQRSDAEYARFGAQLTRAGYLLTWESLVSSQGAEMIMLEDVRGVVEWLNANCELHLVASSKPYQVSFVPPAIEPGKCAICISLSPAQLRKLFPSASSSSASIKLGLTIALFSQGVNEKQSLANVMSKDLAAVHAIINQQAVQQLRQYASRLPTVSKLLPTLVQLVMNQRADEKEVEVLWCAEACTRELMGGLHIMCKSGKDRTAMAVTLEEAKLLSRIVPDWLAWANLLREHGVRIRIAEKNIGKRVYSFNAIQRMALPKEYRPPASVIQDLKTSYKNQNS